ncbi:hypothetical protein, partial [Nocardiopsis metallicus]
MIDPMSTGVPESAVVVGMAIVGIAFGVWFVHAKNPIIEVLAGVCAAVMVMVAAYRTVTGVWPPAETADATVGVSLLVMVIWVALDRLRKRNKATADADSRVGPWRLTVITHDRFPRP